MRTLRIAVISLGAALSACGDSTGVGSLHGTFMLESVSGSGPSAGSMSLTSEGVALRRVRYGAAANEFVALGTFRLERGEVVFALRENEGRSEHLWHVRGELNGDRFTIRYPPAADGPDIVETYRRAEVFTN